MNPKRYKGEPFLKFLDAYVLWAIDELDDDTSDKLADMTPTLREGFGEGGTWQDIVEAQMEFPPNMPDILMDMWEKNVAAAKAAGQVADPTHFAMAVSDKNFK